VACLGSLKHAPHPLEVIEKQVRQWRVEDGERGGEGGEGYE